MTTSEDLKNSKCVPCEGGTEPLTRAQIDGYLAITVGWTVTDDGKIINKRIIFNNFKQNMAFVNKVADLAEEQGHHPDLKISYATLDITLTTHAIGGLSDNDFIMASKINCLKS